MCCFLDSHLDDQLRQAEVLQNVFFSFSDNTFRASYAGPVGSPRAQESRQEPAATSPPGQCLAEGDRQSFLSLTSPLNFSPGGEERPPSAMEEQGITDLYSSVDPEQMPLDLPV